MLKPEERREMIDKIRNFPPRLEALVKGLSEKDLTTPYMSKEWTVAQNIHHLVDSHVNSYVRFRLIVTEDNPSLKGYDQAVWAELPDSQKPDIQDSLLAIRGLHSRWSYFLDNLKESDWRRTGNHSEHGKVSIDDLLVTYADHCDAHIDQIQRTLAAKK